MAAKIECTEFSTYKGFYDNKLDTRKNTLKKVNKFLAEYNISDVINIVEDWDVSKNNFTIIVYYKIEEN